MGKIMAPDARIRPPSGSVRTSPESHGYTTTNARPTARTPTNGTAHRRRDSIPSLSDDPLPMPAASSNVKMTVE